jgi:hypothetical protein
MKNPYYTIYTCIVLLFETESIKKNIEHFPIAASLSLDKWICPPLNLEQSNHSLMDFNIKIKIKLPLI